MTTINHYGKWVDSEEAITGVISINSVDQDALSDEINNGIDLTYEEAVKDFNESYQAEHDQDFNYDDYDEALQDFNDGYESYSPDVLIGEWIKDSKGLYDFALDGEYTAIVRESVIQIIHSKNTARAALCSPCYPGQADLDTKGDYLAYTLPDDMLYKENANYSFVQI